MLKLIEKLHLFLWSKELALAIKQDWAEELKDSTRDQDLGDIIETYARHEAEYLKEDLICKTIARFK